MPPKKKQKVSPPYPPVPKTVVDKIISVCGEIDKPSRQAIQKALANTYNYTNDGGMNKALNQGVKMKKLVQKGQHFYIPGKEPSEYEPKPEKWIPLHPDEKHREQRQDFHGHTMVSHTSLSGGFPSLSLPEIRSAQSRSFLQFAYKLQELIYLYHETGDERRAGTFREALTNMLDLSGYEMEHCNTLNCTVAKDKYGINIGISEDNMKCNMFHDDVKCLRDIYGVGASTVSLIEEWIETGSMKRLENLRNEVDSEARQRVHDKLNFEDGKKDYTIDFVEALGKLADLYEEEEDHRATAFRRAIIALELKSIHSVEDIETQKLIDLKGVGKSTLEMFKEFIETGKIEKLEEMRRQKEEENTRRYEIGRRFFLLADTDVRKAVTQLPKDIKLTLDGEGRLLLDDRSRDQCIGRGCPFTFEYEGDTYEVDGTSDTIEYGGIPRLLTFEGTLTKNGKQSCEISMEDEVEVSDIAEHNVSVTHGDFEKLGFVRDSEEEQYFIDTLNEELQENVVDAYDWPTGHE